MKNALLFIHENLFWILRKLLDEQNFRHWRKAILWNTCYILLLILCTYKTLIIIFFDYCWWRSL